MASIEDLYRAFYGYHEGTAIEMSERTRVFQEYDKLRLNTFPITLTASNGEVMDLEVDASKAFHSIFSLVGLVYSNAHKNYTITRGTGKRARVYVELPKPGVLKTLPAYEEWRAKVDTWSKEKLAAAKKAGQDKMLERLAAEHPDYEDILNLDDDQVRDYLLAQGWTIPEDVTFDHWRPCGWIMTHRPDGYGHQCGSYANVDWDEKKIVVSGWSSDD